MSAQDTKKAKRRKIKKVIKPGQVSSVALQNEPPENTRCIESEDLKEIEKFMDAPYDCDSTMPPLSRGPNPYLGGERCLLCRCERPDPPNAAKIKEETDDKNKSEDASTLSALPLWVCPNCRKSVEEVEKKSGLSSLDTSFLEQEFTVDSTSLPFLSDMNLGTTVPSGEQGSVNGSVCTCEACTERRQIEAEHERETQELQKCWMELRKAVWLIYYRNGESVEDGLNPPDPELTMPEESRITELVHRLCSRDPHQLFRRLESQAREFVLEKKVTLLRQLTGGHKTVAEAREFVGRLLEEYSQLCKAARKLAGLLQELEQDHLKKFKVTWELHNTHLFQSIAYTDPMVQKSLPTLIKQLRQGAASKEAYPEDRHPNLLQRYLKFDTEMSEVNVVWRDCQQLIEQYNEEQEASKVKQKMLKEDWMFFKQQRKLLEQQVLKRSSNQTATQLLECTAGLEAHFTETMRHLLQGTKPSPEECHCPRCNWKRCPCDECTIMHMITCGIINPDSVDNNPSQAPNFNHDSSTYLDDVTPPSMSSTSSSSGQSSPLMEPDRFALHLTDCQKENGKVAGEEVEDESQSEEDEEDEDDEEEDYDDEEEDEDEDEEDDEEEEEEDEEDLEDEDEEETEENSTLQASDFSLPTSSELPPLTDYPQPLGQQGAIPLHPNIMQGWSPEQLTPPATADVNKVTNCDCHHCISQAKAQQVPQEEGQCQCHVCLQQRGKIVSTTLPQHLPVAPRPELHLYPHIHGHTGHVRPLLQPHLYDLHVPMRPPKPVVPPAKVPLKLDFDTPEGLQEHMYHAYGEWDNTYNTRMLLDSHKYGAGLDADLLPPPNLPPGPFISEAMSMDGSAFMNPVNTSSVSNHSPATSMMVPSRPFDIQTSSISTAMSQPPAAQTESCQKATVRRTSRNTANKHQVMAGQVNGQLPLSSAQTPPVTRPATMGGNSAIQPPGEKIQRCKHVSSQSKLSMSQQQHVNHSMATSGGHPLGRSPPELMRGAGPRKEEGKLAMGPNANLNLNPPHSCNHVHPRNSGHLHQPGMPLPHSGGCSNALPQAANGSNVSVGTSTICTDPECETNHDDNYDSIDDSGSEQSSSTSTSNQKEGKYCDCCYCEFFGHSNPPSLPTSKNYAEMRDRLRLRLKRKNEAKQDDLPKPMNSICTASSKSKDPLEVKGLDELLKFINGVDDPKDKQLSAKAAKRARQKQRKADERARKIEEERQRLRQAEKAMKEAAKLCSTESNCKVSRHRSHKEVLERFLEGEESPGPQRKKKKARVKSAAVVNDAGNKTPSENTKTASSKENSADTNTSSKSEPVVSRESKTVPRQLPLRTNNVITVRGSAQTSTTAKAASNDTSKTKPKEEKTKAAVDNTPTPAKANSNSVNPASPKQVAKRTTASKKVSPQNPATSSAPPSTPVSSGQSTATNGSPRTTPQPDRTAQVTSNYVKKGNKKPNSQVQQNNLNNLNGGPQAPVGQTRNGLLIQPANCQKWLVPPKDKPKTAPVGKSAGQPVRPTGVERAVSRAEPNPPKARQAENGVAHPAQQTLRSAEQALRNQEQNKLQTGKNKKKNKKNRNNEDINHIDEIFLPRTDSDLEGGEMDDFERELEEFKRFCFDSTPAPRQKLQVNVNLKDIFAKKKSGLGCS